MSVQVIGLDECKRDLRKLSKDLVDGRGVLRQFHRWWVMVVHRSWNRIKVTGGTFRGVRWAPMQAQYTRADGTVVPAWGGVKRVEKGWGEYKSIRKRKRKAVMHRLKRKGGNVRAKKRPSGKRVKTSSVLMKDTAAMFRDITGKALALTKKWLDVGTSLDYAEEQDRRRRVVFWKARVDETKLGRIYDKAADLAIRKRGFA